MITAKGYSGARQRCNASTAKPQEILVQLSSSRIFMNTNGEGMQWLLLLLASTRSNATDAHPETKPHDEPSLALWVGNHL